MWLRLHQDEGIAQHAYWLPPGSICIRHLMHQRTGGISIQISMMTTPTQWRFAVYFGHQTYQTGGVNRRKCTPSTLITIMWHSTYSISYHMVSELFPRPRCYRLEAVKIHRRDSSQKCRCKALFSSQWRDFGRHWPRIGNNEHRK